MSDLRKAAQQALEALQSANNDLMEWQINKGCSESWAQCQVNTAITALRAALAEPEQPVAYLWEHGDTGRTRVIRNDEVWTASNRWFCVGPLYLGSAPTPQPEPEPVAWWNGRETVWFEQELAGTNPPIENPIPLYTAPPQRKPKNGITNQEGEN